MIFNRALYLIRMPCLIYQYHSHLYYKITISRMKMKLVLRKQLYRLTNSADSLWWSLIHANCYGCRAKFIIMFICISYLVDML